MVSVAERRLGRLSLSLVTFPPSLIFSQMFPPEARFRAWQRHKEISGLEEMRKKKKLFGKSTNLCLAVPLSLTVSKCLCPSVSFSLSPSSTSVSYVSCPNTILISVIFHPATRLLSSPTAKVN